jgi:hypothetical protein
MTMTVEQQSGHDVPSRVTPRAVGPGCNPELECAVGSKRWCGVWYPRPGADDDVDGDDS